MQFLAKLHGLLLEFSWEYFAILHMLQSEPGKMWDSWCLIKVLNFYRIGPLHKGNDYEVTAEKRGYVLVKEDGEMAVFKAFKLGEISVTVSKFYR